MDVETNHCGGIEPSRQLPITVELDIEFLQDAHLEQKRQFTPKHILPLHLVLGLQGGDVIIWRVYFPESPNQRCLSKRLVVKIEIRGNPGNKP